MVAGEGGATVRGPRVLLVPLDPDPVRVGAKAVRGEIELRPGAAGVAVINVLNLEAYLRGVVPAEMGPRAFPLLEALKAQAVAARTYAVAHLGEHAAEGYDLCDSPACQAYEGVEAERPLTDRAVRETDGEVVTYQGRPIDAMYHSTCAGHTEDGGALFPARAAPYLKGVPCRGERTLAAGVSSPRGPWLGPVERLATVGSGAWPRRSAAPRTPHPLAARLAGAQPGPGVAGIVAAFAVPATAATLHVAHGRTAEDAALDLLRLFRLPLPPSPRGERPGGVGGGARGAAGAARRDRADPRGAPRPWSQRPQARARWRCGHAGHPQGASASSSVAVSAGGAAGRVRRRLAGHVVVRGRDVPGPRGRGARGRRRGLVVDVVGEGVLARRARRQARGGGCSGGDGDRTRRVGPGALGVGERPRRQQGVRRDGVSPRPRPPGHSVRGDVRAHRPPRLVLRFLGRGWGHGVGMCQNGAYGLARGGAGYVEILKTYYTGVEVTRWQGGKR